MSEITKITVQTSVVSNSYHKEPNKFEGTLLDAQADLHRRSTAINGAYNLVSSINATGNVEGSIENELKGIHYHQDTKRGQTNVYLYGITIYIHYKG